VVELLQAVLLQLLLLQLVLVAAKRARHIAMGGEPLVPWQNDKPTVVALREIAENRLNRPGGVREAAISRPLETADTREAG